MSDHWLARPRTIRLLWAGFIAVLALTVLAEAFVPWRAHFGIEAVFGFGAWFGFLACAGLIFGAKALALLLKRPDTYYGTEEDARDG
jgi:hypothetical protein